MYIYYVMLCYVMLCYIMLCYQSINQSINEDLMSGSSPEGDVRDVSSGLRTNKQFRPPEHTCIYVYRRESEIHKQCKSIIQGKSVCLSRSKVGRDEFWACPGKCWYMYKIKDLVVMNSIVSEQHSWKSVFQFRIECLDRKQIGARWTKAAWGLIGCYKLR